jgi:hypothetical protein
MAKLLLNELQKKIPSSEELKQEVTKNTDFLSFLEEKKKEFTEFPIIYDNFFDEGKEQTIYYCHNCKKQWIEKENKMYNKNYYYRYYYKRTVDKKECPHCKKEYDIFGPNYKVKEIDPIAFIRLCDVDNGYCLIDYVKLEIVHSNKNIPENLRKYDGTNIDFLIGEFKISIADISESVVSIDYGIRPSGKLSSSYDASYDLLAANSCEFENSKEILLNANFIYSSLNEEMLKLISNSKETDINKALKEFNDDYLSKKAKKVKTKKQDETEVAINNTDFEDIEIEDVINRLNSDTCSSSYRIKSIIFSQLGNKTKFANKCSCGHIFDVELENVGYDSVIKCPKCNAEERTYSAKKSSCFQDSFDVLKYELMPDGVGIAVRIFKITETFYLENREVRHKIDETNRVFFMEKAVKVLNHGRTSWEKGRVTDLDSYSRYYSRYLNVYNTKEELAEIIKNSVFKYSGLTEALGLNGTSLKINDMTCISRNSYIYAWTKFKCIEQLLKTGMKAIVNSIIEEHNVLEQYNKSGTTVYDILDITKPVYLIAKARNASPSELNRIKSLWKLEESLTIELYEEIIELARVDLVILIKEQFNISFKKIVEYIDSCYNNQCIERRESLKIWYDYLKMAKDMDYRLKDNTIKYPSSLKKDHDRASFSYVVVQDEMNQKRFVENAQRNANLYEYSYGDYIIKVPMHPNEVIQEGNVQKHCVASYVNRIRDGETAVCFARKKDDPETAYFTIEVKDDIVVQVKGYCNCAPRDPDFILFLRKWAEKKGLRLRF